ncbi:hypothetical protein PIB30_051737 [Stylosanthes scabra]|uniref:NB-ARC domain-containing protein n=1 Tax=Stylosanthes scabra TaxID=79078 RepID=A0ABU6TIJ1_9FABA|nr:hypothetical protein [Stylosanthes scabra]
MFLKHSSLSTNSKDYATLEPIARNIVEKCKGLPLAVKTLGGLLRNKRDEEYWKKILESEIWELPEDESKIVPALRVSYHYLPSYLKRCFVYCSLFPEDYQFDKDELILLWMAEDLLQPMENNTLENVGFVYFDELVARSFFQSSGAYAGSFVMHDLMHDLATVFAGKFFFRKFGKQHMVDSKTRHLSCYRNPISKFPEGYDGVIHTRTFLCFYVKSTEIRGVFRVKKSRGLRVLAFERCKILSLRDSIGDLIYLRYLNLSKTLIVTLPESLCKLYNLQTLKLRDCHKLEMLPSRMQDLVNLRHLDIRGTHHLKEMPKGMSKLKHLNFLPCYIVGEHEENGIRELGPIDVHGSFCISNLENVNSSSEALEAKMANKKHINILKLEWSSFRDAVDVESERDILKELRPHSNLKELRIDGYRGEILPDWLGLSSYSNITDLRMYDCENCRELPSLGQLPSLQHLVIWELPGLKRIGEEFYKSGESSQEGTPFKSLQTLVFRGMNGWQEWHIPDEFDGFPKLKTLKMEHCPVLKGDLPAHLPALEELTIRDCEELTCSLPRPPKLHQLEVGVSVVTQLAKPHEVAISNTQLAKSVLECLPQIQSPYLQYLKIKKCRSAISISNDHLPDSLQYLEISNCSELTISEPLQHESLKRIRVHFCRTLTVLPLEALPNLKTLSIERCYDLVSLPPLRFAAPNLKKLTIAVCPELDCFGEECLPPSLTTLRINKCWKVARCITSKGLQSEGLTHLSLEQWNEVKSFPTEGCLPASLQSLKLCYFPNLERLDCKGLHHLTSLKKLTIEFCPKLKHMISEKLPASLSKLLIRAPSHSLRRELEKINDPRIELYYNFQELLEAVEQERRIRVTPSRNVDIFRHPALDDPELQQFEELIIQHIAAAAAMRRARHLGRREVLNLLPETEMNWLKIPVGSPSTPLTSDGDEPSMSQLIAHIQNRSSSLAHRSTVSATNREGIYPNERSSTTHSSTMNEDVAGPSDLQSFSDSLKSKFNAMSLRYKESLSKGTRGWKERLFYRNSSVSELGSEVKRELNAGIASVSWLMERLETREYNRVEDASLSNHSTDSSIAETSNQRNVEALGRNSLPGNNSPATFSAGSDSN